MTSRERVRAALNHQQTDRPPIDIGATMVTGISAFNYNAIRKIYGLKEKPVRLFEPLMFLADVDMDLVDAMGGDFVGIFEPVSLVAYSNDNWRPVTIHGQEFLVGEGFTYTEGEDGTLYLFSHSNPLSKPAARMPKGSYYFDHVQRQIPLGDDHEYNARVDYADCYTVYPESTLRYFEKQADYYYKNTDKSIIWNFGTGGFGDFFHVPAPWLEDPHGVRNFEDWMTLPYLEPDYVKEAFEMQLEVCIKELELAYQAMGDKVDICYVSGTDFGEQNCGLMSLDCYREFYKPYLKACMDWIHEHTSWKTMIHTCGAIYDFCPEFIETGLDILNPVQISAKGMDPQKLKDNFGDKLVFSGGTANPQKTMATGTPQEVYEEALKNTRILSKNGGMLASHIHNIQATTPAENVKALFDAFKDA
ncbi:MAG TPA: methyltransferase [Lachnospiraceae bacterium]|nr:methyltransferase [Lachnospiraceae bacterium]